LSLPIYSSLSDAQQDEVVDALHSALAGSRDAEGL
jgi:dTDP-4-amino-4,6-dideoxygalactose transaminase